MNKKHKGWKSHQYLAATSMLLSTPPPPSQLNFALDNLPWASLNAQLIELSFHFFSFACKHKNVLFT